MAFAVEREYAKKQSLFGLPIVHFEEVETAYDPAEHSAFVAISYTKLNRVRERLYLETKRKGYPVVSYVSSRAFVWHNVELGENCFIMKTHLMLELFETLQVFLRSAKIRHVVYKAIPHIYHQLPAEEDLYTLYRVGAKLVRRDVSTTIDLQSKLTFSKGRKYEIKQAQKYGLEVKRSNAFDVFMAIEEQVLDKKYDSKPTHTAAELEMLAEKFPDAIKLFAATRNSETLAGVVIYESQNVVHAQYIAASDEGKNVGALDLILNYLITDYCSGKKYFDFGISTVNDGHDLNLGLIENKQSFGGRAVVYDFYELEI